MAEPINEQSPDTQEPTPGTGGEVTFTQAEVDALVSKEKARAVAKATKGMPGEEELSAFRAWKESQQTEKEKWETITKERDESKTALTTAQAELEQYKREKFLLSKGIALDDVDYYAFKIGKLVTDELDFEAATVKFLADKEPSAGTMRVDFGASVGGGKAQQSTNEKMNSIFRNFRK